MIFAMQISYAALIWIVIQNGLPDPDSDAVRYQNVISCSLGHNKPLHNISSKSVGNFFDNQINSDFGLDPDGDPDRHQNLITWFLGHALPLQKISSKSVHNFFSYPTDRQTDKQTEVKTIPPSSAEVISNHATLRSVLIETSSRLVRKAKETPVCMESLW